MMTPPMIPDDKPHSCLALTVALTATLTALTAAPQGSHFLRVPGSTRAPRRLHLPAAH